jgi:hypothetical protein
VFITKVKSEMLAINWFWYFGISQLGLAEKVILDD